ncbi:BCCT family transporter [Clostridium sp. DL1XJH146]
MMKKINKSKLRPVVFYPAFILLVITIILNFANPELFLTITTGAKDFMTVQCGWMFSLAGVACLIGVIFAYFSPLGDVRVGGKDAKPLLNKGSWFAITLTTTIASGIMFWGTAEPIWHLAYPPIGIEPMSADAAKFAMETLFLHWTFVPYAFYTVPTIVFAFAYYNMKKPFSVTSQISPVLGKRDQRKFESIVDAIILFAIATGIASSFATAVMNMGGGINALTGIASGKSLYIIVTIAATALFTLASGSGLFKGINYLAKFNVYLYYILIAALVILGPTVYMFSLGTEGFGGFLTGFFSKALFTGAAASDSWATGWTTFYWTNWMAWAPVTAVFLARISYGYKIKEVIKMNFLIPAGFGALWMAILGGTAINFQMTGRVDILSIMNEQGSGAAGYAVLKELPFSGILMVIYLIAVIVSFATATDSTTNAMASICTTGITEADEEAPLILKVLWGTIIGAMAVIFLGSFGVDGIKMLSYLGGFPALVLGVLCLVSLFLIMSKPHDFDISDKVKKEEVKEEVVVESTEEVIEG